MPVSGSFNVTRRAHRSDENFHRGKRRKGVDRLAMLESLTAPPRPRRRSRVVELVSAVAGFLSPRPPR